MSENILGYGPGDGNLSMVGVALRSRVANVAMFSYLYHPENEVNLVYWFFDFYGRYVNTAQTYHPAESLRWERMSFYRTYSRNPSVRQKKMFKFNNLITQTIIKKLMDSSKTPKALELIAKAPTLTWRMTEIIVIKHPGAILHLCKRRKRDMLESIRFNPNLIRYLPQTEENCNLAIKYNAQLIHLIKNPSAGMAIYALGKKVPLHMINCQDERYLLAAIAMCHNNISYVKNFTPAICDYVAKNCELKFILHLPNPPHDKVLEHIKKGESLTAHGLWYIEHIFTEEIYYEYIKHHPHDLQSCRVQSERIIKKAVDAFPCNFAYAFQTRELCLKFLKYCPRIFRYIKDQFRDEEICKLGIAGHLINIYYISNPSQRMIDYANKCYPHRVEVIKKMLEKNSDGFMRYLFKDYDEFLPRDQLPPVRKNILFDSPVFDDPDMKKLRMRRSCC